MKVQIIYYSLTGSTEKLAKSIYDGLKVEEKSIHNFKDGVPVLDGDIILVGYWGISSGPNEDFQEFLKTIKNKAVGIFCTLGYYADTAYAHSTLETAENILKDSNDIIGSFVCNGAVSPELMKGQVPDYPHTPTEQKEIRWEVISSHPTAAECQLAAERFNERVYLYRRCKELGISFTSII